MSLPAWATDPDSLTLTEEQYDELPDDVRKMVEVIDGHVIFCQSGTPEHSDVARSTRARASLFTLSCSSTVTST